ncbi:MULTISPECIES: hypothetical protein [unclassified Methylobacterium]|jgi:hypothetical protein|uniref:hypothetical protein n=1 Tax=unclassified Methylobacterium TaxID=2615210 RepID=UPI0006FBF7E5|nr:MULTISPECIES: hypothetical protein [unclassified Methylobacterium]KQO58167.1 hypothetical protein ASF24_16210 [Methylobacterium sp. Leaf86]KQO97226.1 hypothetical protein ASF32_16865 [Methylobacterium sp. Leaf91]MBO1020315.1 hypothetical protein [Methylobacterium sp. SD274]
MRSVHTAIDNVVPFRRPGRPQPQAPVVSPSLAARRVDQRALMDAVYASGTLAVAAGDRETKLIAARLQVYGFLTVEELSEEGALRRLRPSEAIRAQADRPWRLSKAAYGSGLSVTVPAADDFLFDSSAGASA